MALEPSLSGVRVQLFCFLRKLPVIKLPTHFLGGKPAGSATHKSVVKLGTRSPCHRKVTPSTSSVICNNSSQQSPPSPHHELGKGLLEKTRLPPAQGMAFLSWLCSPPELLRHSGLSHALGSAQRRLHMGCFSSTSLLCSPVFRILSDSSFDPTFFQSCVEHVTLIG